MKKFLAIFLSTITALSLVACKDKNDGGDTGAGGTVGATLTDAQNKGYIQIDKSETNNYLVKNNQAEYKIVVPAEATATEEYAATVLKNQIDSVAHCNIIIETDEGKTFNQNDKVIAIGKTIYQTGAALPAADYTNLNGGYLIKSAGNVYVLDADTKNGVIYAAQNFATFFFGVEYLTWDTTYYPEGVTDVKAYSANIKDVPTFRLRDFYSYPVWYKSQEDMAKLAMNSPSAKTNATFDDPFYYGYYYTKSDGSKGNSAREGHSIEQMLCVDAYREGYLTSWDYKTTGGVAPGLAADGGDFSGAMDGINFGYLGLHPDWYAYDPSYNRVGGCGRSQEEFCYSNGLTLDGEYDAEDTDSFTTKIIEICKKMIQEETSENAEYLMLGHGDYYAKCKCEKCLQMYETFGEDFSGLYCTWVNAVAGEVKKWMAEENIDKPVKFVILAYSKSIAAPVVDDGNGNWVPRHENIQLRDDIVVKMAWRYCVYHSLWDETCEENAEKRLEFEQWSTLAEEFTIWDYTCNFPDYLWHLEDYGALKENYLYYTTLGVKHLLTQGTPSEYNYYEYHLKAYVSLKLMWNVNQDVNALIEKFNNLYFGEKYAPYVNEYRNIFANQAAILDAERKATGGYHQSTTEELDMKSPNNYSRAMLEGAIRTIDNGIALAKADSELSNEEKEALILKLRSVKITPQYMLLRLGYLIDENEIKDVAKDLYESTVLLKLTYVREGTYDYQTFAVMLQSYGI